MYKYQTLLQLSKTNRFFSKFQFIKTYDAIMQNLVMLLNINNRLHEEI